MEMERAVRIAAWLKEDGLQFATEVDNQIALSLVISIGGFGISAFVRRDKVDRLIIATTICLKPEAQRAFGFLSAQKKTAFVKDCKMALLKIGVHCLFQPSNENPKRVSLFRVLFHDTMTKHSFLKALLVVSHAWGLVNLRYSRLRDAGLNP